MKLIISKIKTIKTNISGLVFSFNRFVQFTKCSNDSLLSIEYTTIGKSVFLKRLGIQLEKSVKPHASHIFKLIIKSLTLHLYLKISNPIVAF